MPKKNNLPAGWRAAGLLVVLALCGTVWAALDWPQLQAWRAATTQAAATTAPLSIYEWRDVQTLPADYGQQLVALHAHGYRTLYVSMSGALSTGNLAAYLTRLHGFALKAARRGITIGVVAGDPQWVSSPDMPDIGTLLAAIHQYNVTYAQPITLLALDIEPYTAEQVPVSTIATQVTAAVQYTDGMERTLGLAMLRTTVVVPFWLHTNGLLRAVAALPDGALTVMAYRSQPDGADGSIALARPFFEQDARLHLRLPITIAQDTSDAQPAKTTFYNSSRTSFREALYTVDHAFRPDKNYAGIIINDEPALMRKGP